MRQLFLPGQPLAPLAALRQFITWREVWEEGATAPKKIPVQLINDPATWLTWQDAVAADEQHVGFVITRNDPFVFVDVDKQWLGDNWSPLAQSVYAGMNGAYFEISHSQLGFHIIGTYPNLDPNHRCTKKGLPVEIYSHSRWVALTGLNAVGNVMQDLTLPVSQWIEHIGGTVDKSGLDWTTEPIPEYALGGLSDDELIEKMLSTPVKNPWTQNKATVPDLWYADGDALGYHFPPKKADGTKYDKSAADLALCSHLAFWAGKNCEKVDRLFRRSGLMREKWDRADGYGRNTVMLAVSKTQNVYTGYHNQMEDRIARKENLSGIMQLDQIENYFQGCVYIRDLHKVFVPDGALLDEKTFNVDMGGFEFPLDANGKNTKSAWEAFTMNRAFRFPKVKSVIFRPDLPGGQVIDDKLNIYIPADIRKIEGDPSLFLDFISKMLPDPTDQEILLSYCASMVQNKGKKFQWCVILQGTQGNGKSTIGRILSYCVGEKYSYAPRNNSIAKDFNKWLAGKLLVHVNEIYTPGKHDAVQNLLEMITEDRIEIEGKGDNQVMMDNRANFIMCTNHRDAIRKTKNDRRYAMFFTAQQRRSDLFRDGMNKKYFIDLWDWLREDGLAIIANFLDNYQIRDEFNPATKAIWAPKTSSHDAVIRLSMSTWEQAIMESVWQGEFGFRGDWISSVYLQSNLRALGLKLSPNQVRMTLEDLGYIPHPGYPDGRSPVPVQCDFGKRSVLYVNVDRTDLLNTPDPLAAYCEAQGYEAPPALHAIQGGKN